MNLVTLVGRLTADPNLKYSQSGKAFCKFTLAVQRDFKKDEADFINCTAWDKRAEAIAEYLRKGRRIAVQGRLNVNSYDKDGETKWVTDVIVDKFEFIDSANNDNEKKEYQKDKDEFEKNIDNTGVDDPDDFPF